MVPALIWLIAAFLLVAAEVLVGELVLLMMGGGALAAAATAFFFQDAPAWVPAVVFAVVSLLLIISVRPVAKRHFLSRPAVPTNAEALLGTQAIVLAPVDVYKGRVKIGGDVWSARTSDTGNTYGQGEHLVVLEIDGATAVVGKGSNS